MIRIWEKEYYWHEAYAFACTVNEINTPYRHFFERTKISSNLNRLQFKSDFSVIPEIISEIKHSRRAADFLKGGFLVAVPPSVERDRQPVEEMADALVKAFDMSYLEDAIPCAVVDTTNPLSKDEQKRKSRKYRYVYEPDEVNLSKLSRDTRIIIFDDIYDTGETIKSCAIGLKDLGFTDINVFTVGYSVAAKKRFKKNHTAASHDSHMKF